MQHVMILIAGNNAEKVRSAVELANADKQFTAAGAVGAESAIEYFQQLRYDAVILLNDLQQETQKLQKLIVFQQPGMLVINADMIDPALLGSIPQQIATSNKRSFQIVDDALRAAMLPIQIS